MSAASADLQLLFRAGTRLCAMPVEHVVETMRPLPIESFADLPAFVSGVSLVRGMPVPVVNAAALLGAAHTIPGRFVTVRIGERRIALAVDAVIGVQSVPGRALADLPPLLRRVSADLIEAIGTMDAELLVVLRSVCFVPESMWQVLESRAAS